MTSSHRERAETPPARHLPDHPPPLQRAQQRRPGLRRDPEPRGERLRRQRGRAQQRVERVGQPRPFVAPATSPLPCSAAASSRSSSRRPIRALSATRCRKASGQVTGRPRPTTRSAASLRRPGRCVAIAEADGRIGRPDRQEDARGCAGAGDRPMAASSAWSGRRAIGDAGLHPALRRMRRGSSGGRGGPPPPLPAAVSAAPDGRRRRVRRPPGGEVLRVEPAGAERGERLGRLRRAGERESAGVFGGRRSRRASASASAIARSPSAIASNGGSAQSRRLGGTGEGLRQAALTGARPRRARCWR